MSRHEVRIGDATFYVARFEPFLALEIAGDLQKKFLAPFLGMIDAKEEGQTEAFLGSLEKLSANLDGHQMRALAERLLLPEYVSVAFNGREPVRLDQSVRATAFRSAADIVQLCVEVVKHNYADFIDRAKGLISSGLGAR